ncbi:MAG: membrane dipeptidase [Bradymonadia bacterium]
MRTQTKGISISLNLLAIGLLLAGSASAETCGKIDFGGIFNKNTSSRLSTRRLTFARQSGKLVGATQRRWNTFVAYDQPKASLHLSAESGQGVVAVTICSHRSEVDTGKVIDRFTFDGTKKNVTRKLDQLKNKYVSVTLKGQKGFKSLNYIIRLKRPKQGRLNDYKKAKSRVVKKRLKNQKGFADLHNHQASDKAFGGAFNIGYVHGPHQGKLKSCDGTHSSVFKKFAAGTGVHKDAPSKQVRKPDQWWPHYSDGSHVQTHIEHLKKAHQSGLRLMLATAVSNQALCLLTSKPSKRRKIQCDDMDSAKTQLKAMIDFDAKHDWYKIVHNPWEARLAIANNQLAVVLGIEVSNLMPESHGDWRDQLDELYDMGVRSIELAHETDSRFVGNAHQHGRMFKVMNNLKKLSQPITQIFGFIGADLPKSKNVKDFIQYFTKSRSVEHCEKKYRDLGFDCNKLGFSSVGRELVKELMKKKMFLPIDHISRRARAQIYDMSKGNGFYPLFASHTRTDKVSHPQEQRGGHGSHEYMLSDDDLERIRRTGGLIGLRAGHFSMLEIKNCINQRIRCWGSSESLAQNLCHAARTGLAMAMGTDFGGPVNMTAPRFAHKDKRTHRWDGLPAACPRNVEMGFVTPFGYQKQFKAYEPKTIGGNHRDYKVRGLAHTGHEKDLIEEMRSLGAPVSAVRLDYSAESFIRMWERMYKSKGRKKLSDKDYRKMMGTKTKKYDRKPYKPGPYNAHLPALFKKCVALKRSGSKECDSIKDWEAMVHKDVQKSSKCPAGLKRVTVKGGVLFCKASIAKKIARSACRSTKKNGVSGSLDELDGYCGWRRLDQAKPHILVRQTKEACPKGAQRLTTQSKTKKPFCKMASALPISKKQCLGKWNGKIDGKKINGYCFRDEGSYMLSRKLKGHTKDSVRKCTGNRQRVHIGRASSTLYCKTIGAAAVTERACREKKKGATGKVKGYCTKTSTDANGQFVQVWTLKGYNNKGERKCKAGFKKHAVANKANQLFCKAVVGKAITEGACQQKGGSTKLVSGFCSVNRGDWYQVIQLAGRNQKGQRKCKAPYKRFDVSKAPNTLFCKQSVAQPISAANCRKNKGSTTKVEGYCAFDKGTWFHIRRLDGRTGQGDKSYKCPAGLTKVVYETKTSRLFCKALVSTKISAETCRRKKRSTSLLKGYCAEAKGHYYKVQALK